MGSVMGPLACEMCEERGGDHLRDDAEMIGQGMKFERTQRLTGYLAPPGRINNAKKAEIRDRVTHG